MHKAHYDQRVLALVEVAGGERDWREAEQVFEAEGWPVIEHFPSGAGPTAGVLDPDPSSRIYRIEVRIYGSTYRAATGAAWQVEKIARAARVHMQVRRADLIEKNPKQVFDWRIVPTQAVRSPRSALAQMRFALGTQDNGTHVSGQPREALRLARRSAPDGSLHPEVSVRPVRGGARSSTSIWGEAAPSGRIFLIAMGFTLGALPAAISGRHDLVPLLSTLGSGFGLFASLDARSSDIHRVMPVLLLFGTMGMFTVSIFADLSRFSPVQQMAIPMLPFIVYGVWLVARQWTWGEWVAWAAPLAATLLLSSFVGAAPVLHAWYAQELSISASDLDVPGIWQVGSALKLLSTMVFLLAVPALWGFARHFHLIRTGDQFNFMLYVALLSALIIGCGLLSAQSAEQAASKTSIAAKKGGKAPPYFGVKPEWICIFPTVPQNQVASEGGRLDARRAYLSLGSSAGQVTVLELGSANPIKISTKEVALVPTISASRKCG